MTRWLCLPRTVAGAGLLSLLTFAPCQAGVVLTSVDPVVLDTSGSSVSGVQTAVMKFVNELSVDVDVYWIDYGGSRVFYFTLPAGSTQVQLTFLTHPWLVVQAGTGGTAAQGTGTLLAGFVPATATPWDSGNFDVAYISAPAGPPPTVKVVMTGLDNPRGLAFGPDGALYVAEAGKGGAGPCVVMRGETLCAGATGAVSRLRHGTQERIATGMPSHAVQPSGGGAIGPHDISFLRKTAYVTIGLGADPAVRAVLGDGFGHLVRLKGNGSWSFSTDISQYEADHNPDGFVPDSNPYGLLAGAGGTVLTDAGGNDLLAVAPDGTISTLAVFPARPGRSTDAVPTSVARGPDGALYVGELTGVPFNPGAANIYRVAGTAPVVWRGGFTDVIDIAFGCDGRSLYVLQHATGPFLSGSGALIRVAPDGGRTTIASAELSAPTSVVISCGDERDDDGHDYARGNDGDDDHDDENEDRAEVIYVSNRGTSAGIGEVLRIRAAQHE